MAISVRCHWCDRRFRSSDRHRGKTTECPKCGKPLRIEGENLPDHDVFISYSSRDRDAAEAVCEALEAERIRCWIAPRNIVAGMEWSRSIIEAIGESRAMVLIYSSHANGSQQVVREVERAVNKRVPIVPVRTEDTPPSKNLEYYISASHWLDALDGPIERHLPRLVAMVDTLLGSCEESATPAGALSPSTAALPTGTAAGPNSRVPRSAAPAVVQKAVPPPIVMDPPRASSFELSSASSVPPEILAGTRRPVRQSSTGMILALGVIVVLAVWAGVTTKSVLGPPVPALPAPPARPVVPFPARVKPFDWGTEPTYLPQPPAPRYPYPRWPGVTAPPARPTSSSRPADSW